MPFPLLTRQTYLGEPELRRRARRLNRSRSTRQQGPAEIIPNSAKISTEHFPRWLDGELDRLREEDQ